MRASAAGAGGLAISARSARADLPVPPATGRIHRDGPARRAELYSLMGDLPDRERPIKGEKKDEREADGYVLESWDAGPERARAGSGTRRQAQGPERARAGRALDHSHGGGYTIGKKEFVEGRSYLLPTPYAKALTAEGYVALCIDHCCYGERANEIELETVKAMRWQGRVLWGMMVYDSIRALDWLARGPTSIRPGSACSAFWRRRRAARRRSPSCALTRSRREPALAPRLHRFSIAAGLRLAGRE